MSKKSKDPENEDLKSDQSAEEASGKEVEEAESAEEDRADGDEVIEGGPDDEDGRRQGSGSKRTLLGVLAGVAVLAAGGIGAYVFGVFEGEEDPPSPTPSPSSVEPSPSGPLSYFDDGIAPGEYPAAAVARGEGYPEALRMEEWVWDLVGPDWMLALYGPDTERPSSSAVVYLVSSEGVHFELASLPTGIAGNPQIVSWHESAGKARIVWNYWNDGGLLDLGTGAVDPTSFTMDSGTSTTEIFVASNAGNREVWLAYSEDWLDFGMFTWTEEGGWSRLFGANRDVVMASGNASNTGGSAILFEIAQPYDSGLASPRSGAPGRPNLIAYNLDTGRETFVRPQWPADLTWCYFSRWIDEVSVVYSCWNEATEEHREFRVYIDGDRAVQPWEVPSDFDLVTQGEVVALDGIPLEFVSERANSQVYEIRMLTDDGSVVAASFEDHLSRAGHVFGGVIERAPGVVRFHSHDGIVLGIDTVTGFVVPYAGSSYLRVG